MKNIVVIGAGFSGLSVASFLAQKGFKVTVLEKHEMPGGRARMLKSNGYTFDMGPSWYWMPDVFERYFQQFNKKVSDYYQLTRLDPSYRVVFENQIVDVPADYKALQKLFESIEEGSSQKLDAFLKEAQFKYEIGIQKLVHKPGLKITELIDWQVIKGVVKLDVFNNMKKHVHKYFKNKKLQQLIEFPVLFLGATANDIPALYSLMNYADIKLGTWFPKGGMYSVVDAMYKLAVELGVQFQFNANVTSIHISNKKATSVSYNNTSIDADAVVASADYHFVEQNLLPQPFRNYSEKYWNKKEFAPSCLLYYIGINKKLKNPVHHQLFFDTNFDKHSSEIYKTKEWPTDPLFYVSVATATDKELAPPDSENLFFLIPVATGLLGDDHALRESYFEKILKRFEEKTGENIKDFINFKKCFGINDFVNDYGAYKGNAYGLANTLMQTANLKPKCINKKVKNLFYTGQLTIPGPGVPPSLISGEVVAKIVESEMLKN